MIAIRYRTGIVHGVNVQPGPRDADLHKYLHKLVTECGLTIHNVSDWEQGEDNDPRHITCGRCLQAIESAIEMAGPNREPLPS